MQDDKSNATTTAATANLAEVGSVVQMPKAERRKRLKYLYSNGLGIIVLTLLERINIKVFRQFVVSHRWRCPSRCG